MKKLLYLLVMPLLAIISCEKPEPEPDPVVGKITLSTESELVFSDEGESQQVAFTATLDWAATSDQDWMTVEPKSGQAGEAAVTLRASKNTSDEPRTAKVTLTCGEDTKTIEVTQKQAGALVLAQSTIAVEAAGGKITITAKANSNVTATVDASASWITDVTTKALVDYIFDFQIAANESEESRSGKIVFTNNDGNSETVTIQQDGVKPEFPANVKGKVTCGGKGVAEVLVSDGVEIVKTDAEGNYAFHSDKKWRYVFVINPSGYDFPINGILPTNYKLISQKAEDVEEVNFELEKTQEDNYTLLILGDMHLANWERVSDVQQFNSVATDLNKHIAEIPGKKYVMTLGDMTYDVLWVSCKYGLNDYLQTMNNSFSGLPFFHTMGNHDNEMEVSGDVGKAMRYTQTLAPNYYSFNLGKIHYIILDSIDYTDIGSGKDAHSKYKEKFTAEQLEWLRKDLSFVDKSTPVIVASHAALSYPSASGWYGEFNGLSEFLSIFEGYNVQYYSGHTHDFFYREYNPNFVEYNSGSVCGSWWFPGRYYPGLYIAQDGTPGGYTVLTVNGTENTRYYQSFGHDADYQFRAYDMNEVKKVVTTDLTTKETSLSYINHIQNYEENAILVNVWGWCDDWTVEIIENGAALTVEHVQTYDPLHVAAVSIPGYNEFTTSDLSTENWIHFFKAIASTADSDVTIKVTDSQGKVYTETMNRPKAFVINDFIGQISRTKPTATLASVSSSSLVFGWNTDALAPYKLALYKDAACTNLVQSFEVPANHSCWGGLGLKFAFGGLEPATSYWFVVTDLENNQSSDPVEGRTEAFTLVDPSKVINATVGTVLLAEDFGNISWGNDQLAGAAGCVPDGKPFGPISGEYTDDNGTFQVYDKASARLFGDMVVPSDEALYNWGFYGNSAVYTMNGYLRVCTSSSSARTHVVTPALSGIPEGKIATIDVAVTSALYESSSNDVAIFVNDYSSLSRSLNADRKDHADFSSKAGKFTGASLSGGYELDAKVKEWTTKTVRISGVDCNSCLVIGSFSNVSGKNRFFLDDVVVTLVSLEDKPEAAKAIVAENISTSSSTLIFSWLENDEVSSTITNAFTATLYKDEACTVVDQSFDIPKGSGVWNGKKPKFVFGGLRPSTDYWFKVYDTTNNIESAAVKATTDAFSHVQLPTSITSPGVVLAEDFGEIRWDFDHMTGAVGFRPADRSDWSNTEVKTSENNSGNGIFDGYHYSSGGELAFTSCGTAIDNSRLAGWSIDTKAYIHPGYIKLGETKKRGWVLTPAFTVPEGKKAVVNVTVTAARYNNTQSSNWCIVILNEELAKYKAEERQSYFDWPDIEDSTLYQEFALSGTSWETKTISGLEVRAGDRVCFGGKRYHDGTEGGDLKGRAFISDMTVEVVEIVNE